MKKRVFAHHKERVFAHHYLLLSEFSDQREYVESPTRYVGSPTEKRVFAHHSYVFSPTEKRVFAHRPFAKTLISCGSPAHFSYRNKL